MGIAHPLTVLAGPGPGAAQTAALTTIVPADAHTTPDYALTALSTTSPYGFAVANEAISFVWCVQNLQVRLAALETKLQTLGIIL